MSSNSYEFLSLSGISKNPWEASCTQRKGCEWKHVANWFMFAIFSFKTVFWFLSVLEKKKSGDVLTRLTLTLRLSIAFRTKGGFLDSVELSLSLRFSFKTRWKTQIFHERNTSSAYTHYQWDQRQNYEVLWKAGSCHPSLGRQHALAQPDPATSLELCPSLGAGCEQREALS